MRPPTVVVVFTTRYRAYNAGEQAGFSRDNARQLVAAGVAEYADQGAPRQRRADSTTAAELLLEAETVAAAADTPVLGHPEREPEPGASGTRKGRGSKGRHKP